MSSSADTEKFWVDDPCVLFKITKIVPSSTMTKDEKLNALTRLSIIIGAGMYFMKYEHALTFLLLALLMILIIKYGTKKEGFAITPTYQGLDLQQTVLAPLFAEEWQIYPPAYDLYENAPPADVTFMEPLKPQSYPYGQYLTHTNLLPSDEYSTHMLNGSVRDAREYVNSTFLRNDLAFRENMTALYKKKIQRRFRNSRCNDTFSPYQSY